MVDHMLGKVAVVGLVLGLSGCNSPVALSPAPLVSGSQLAQHPYFSRVDAATFGSAEVLYPASNGHHIIPVADLLLSKTLQHLPQGAAPNRIALQKFSGVCDAPSFAIAPKVTCEVELVIAVDEVPVGPGLAPIYSYRGRVGLGSMFAGSNDIMAASGMVMINHQVTYLIETATSSMQPE